jgi:SAM-dependent methyltransferase
MEQKPYLNIGAGRIILPGPRPGHHSLIDAAIYDYPLWVNADRNAEPGIDTVVDFFRYPWPFEDNSFDAALLTHLVEHIPHVIVLADDSERARQLAACQDGWYAFFAELWRVLTPGAIAHILSPYGWSQGAITDPTHTRLIVEHTFTHSMQPDTNSPFYYETAGLNFRQVEQCKFGITPMFAHLVATEADSGDTALRKQALLQDALMTRVNVAYEVSAKLEAVK